ncbi:hypothetical protein [Pseudomonas sp. Fl4BN1]|uniref:hypothetical protein n=1 Tax=Pseudomonas sp. Fl4BN1 TaxID=2697651 RepID=UPI00137777A8|nr:hypothetical protein [Pseudomonas sp. Fl4BN1]NBF12840.1 hypothetical protein [Pseudomonas sp. Fl4BN1]
MQKIGASTASANASGEFTEGNPGAGVAATLLKAAWLNAIQRELVQLVEGAGLTLDAADDSQILKAIQAIQAKANTWLKLSGKPTTVVGFGITDVFTKLETTAAIQQRVADLVASSPAALDTLKELADALGNDPNFAVTMTNALAGKASKATTLAGYGINNAYTRDEANSKFMTALGFPPVQQGTGVGQTPNLVKIGWSASGLKATVDTTDFGVFWLSSNFDPNNYVRKAELLPDFGVSQSWQDVTALRALSVTYSNSTARAIALSVSSSVSQNGTLSIFVGGVVVFTQTVNNATSGSVVTGTTLVPPGATYQVTASYYTIAKWSEFR